MAKLTDFKYMIYDVYGTLADWESGLYMELQPLLSRYPSSSKWSRDEAIRAFLSVESDIQAQHPSMLYSDLLAKTHEVLELRLIAAENGNGTGPGVTDSTLEGKPSSPSGTSHLSEQPSTSRDTSASPVNEHTIFGNSIRKWAPFPDSAKALQELSRHFHLIVLSNVDHASFAHTHAYLSEGTFPSHSDSVGDDPAPTLYSRPFPNSHPRDLWIPRLTPGSKSPFSLILTAQDVGAYKPAHTGFLAVLDAIRSDPFLLGPPGSSTPGATMTPPTIDDIRAQTLSVAQSLSHDHQPAKELGITSVWIDRQGASWRPVAPGSDGSEFGWTWRFETLADLARAVSAESESKPSA
ncbi:hypothetical protein H0H93_010902 [Arthromyces matolae]|nr:hypothetical protein H0H93_010902 [Arthromyces matolae]